MSSNPQQNADLVSFTEEIYKGKPHFLCSGYDEIFWFPRVSIFDKLE